VESTTPSAYTLARSELQTHRFVDRFINRLGQEMAFSQSMMLTVGVSKIWLRFDIHRPLNQNRWNLLLWCVSVTTLLQSAIAYVSSMTIKFIFQQHNSQTSDYYFSDINISQGSVATHQRCERSLVYDSVFSVFLLARYAQWFPMENDGNFGAPYLQF